MVREYPALVITDTRDLSKNSWNPAFAHPNLCPAWMSKGVITDGIFRLVNTKKKYQPS